MKTILLFIISFTLSLYGCKNHTPNASTAHRHESAAEHASHDHEAEDHDHEAEGEGHNHPSPEKRSIQMRLFSQKHRLRKQNSKYSKYSQRLFMA